MNIITEADRAIKSSPDEDVSRFGDADALSERIREWLNTPEGTVADKPNWGHNLKGVKFDPLNINLAVVIELAIVDKLPQDIRDLVLLGIRVDEIEIDFCNILIRHQLGDTVTKFKL